MSSSRKRKDNSTTAESNNIKQQKNDLLKDFLSRYFLEEEFKTKFTRAFRYVNIDCVFYHAAICVRSRCFVSVFVYLLVYVFINLSLDTFFVR